MQLQKKMQLHRPHYGPPASETQRAQKSKHCQAIYIVTCWRFSRVWTKVGLCKRLCWRCQVPSLKGLVCQPADNGEPW